MDMDDVGDRPFACLGHRGPERAGERREPGIRPAAMTSQIPGHHAARREACGQQPAGVDGEAPGSVGDDPVVIVQLANSVGAGVARPARQRPVLAGGFAHDQRHAQPISQRQQALVAHHARSGAFVPMGVDDCPDFARHTLVPGRHVDTVGALANYTVRGHPTCRSRERWQQYHKDRRQEGNTSGLDHGQSILCNLNKPSEMLANLNR